MVRSLSLVFSAFLLAFLVAGCGNPMKRPPGNVFPGSENYQKRIDSFKITPAQAYDIAHELAETEGKLHFLSRRPTVVAKRWYVFSMPQSSGATLQGYHVSGDTGEVKFVNDKKIVANTR